MELRLYKLSFSPSFEYRGHSLNVALPFHINENYSVYAIEDMIDYQLDMLSDSRAVICWNDRNLTKKLR